MYILLLAIKTLKTMNLNLLIQKLSILLIPKLSANVLYLYNIVMYIFV